LYEEQYYGEMTEREREEKNDELNFMILMLRTKKLVGIGCPT
jgi:hypothetical protein